MTAAPIRSSAPTVLGSRLFRRSLLVLAIPICGAFGAFGMLLGEYFEQEIVAEQSRRLEGAARVIAMSVHPLYPQILGPEDEDTVLFERVCALLEERRASADAGEVLLLDPEMRVLAWADGAGADVDASRRHAGTPDPLAAAHLRAGSVGKRALDERGVFVSEPLGAGDYQRAYAFIRSESGKSVGIVAVTLPRNVAATLAGIRRNVWFLVALAAFVALGIATLVTRSYVLPVVRLAARMHMGPEGRLPEDVRVNRRDELGDLMHAFNRMLQNLRLKDEELHRLLSRVEHRAQYLEEYSASLVQQMGAALVAVDAAGCVTRFNRVAEELFNRGEDDVAGKPVEEALDAWPKLARAVGHCARRGEPTELGDVAVKCADARTRRIDFSVVPLRRIAGARGPEQSAGAIAVGHDRTRLRELEEKVRRGQHLARLGEFSAGIAHEVRNPLGAIKGFAGHVLRRIEAPADRALVEKIIGEVDALGALVADFLEFAGKRAPDRVARPLAPLVRRAADLAASGDDAPQSAALDLDETVRTLVDGPAVERATLNLLRNALEAGGEVTARVRIAGGRAVIEIRDTGEGMDAETVAGAFEPFFTTRPRGTGLGLAIVHRIVEENAGDINIESAPGKGTTVTMTFEALPEESGQ